MGFASELRGSGTRCVMAPDGRVYQIRRVRSADLAQHKHVEIVGAAAVAEEMSRLQAEQKAEADAWKAAHTAPEQKAKAKERKAEQDAYNAQMQQRALMQALARNPKIAGQFASRVDAYVCAGVVGGGSWTGEGEPDPGYVDPDLCDVAPVSVVLTQEEEGADSLWVAWIDEKTRGFLAEAVIALSGAPSVATFRRAG